NELDDEGARRVAVISDEMRKSMWPDKPALGSTFTLNGIRFIVIGVLEPLPQENQGPTVRIFIPFATMAQLFPYKGEDQDLIGLINYQPLSRATHDRARDEVRAIIARNHGGFDPTSPDVWDDWDTVETSDNVGKIFTAMNWFLGGVGVVT